MIKPEDFYNTLKEYGIDFFTGVPDSLLKDFCAYLSDNRTDNIIAANEGNSIALALGYHLATNKIGVVYMQNSGLGNAINPLSSLAHKDVYSVPILLMVGWRGEPGKNDEPQHMVKGKITLDLLETLGVAYSVLPDTIDEANQIIRRAISYMNSNNSPYALVVKKGTFEEYNCKKDVKYNFGLNREDTLRFILPLLESNAVVVSTTGKLSRELFELRKERNEKNDKDFLTVGGMGHASSIALGIALQKPNRNIYCFDGDGALIMHMGSLSTVGMLKPKNFKHVVFNNFSHDSVGGQPTASSFIDLKGIAKSNGYNNVFLAETEDQIKEQFKTFKDSIGPSMLILNINKGARKDLGRPTKAPVQNKTDFMEFLKGDLL